MDKNHFKLYCISLFCLALLLLALPASAANNSLEIKCQDSAGNPVAAANVQIQQLETFKWKDKKSDPKGIALFSKIDDGLYRILARKDGFAPAVYEFAPVRGGTPVTVTLKFEPGDAQKKVYFEDPALRQKAQELLSQGSDLLRGNKFAEAEKELKSCLEINPSNPETLFNLSIAYLQQRKWDEAEQALKRSSQLLAELSSLPPPKEGGGPPYADLRQRADTLLSQVPLFKLRSEADKALSERKFDVAVQKYNEALKIQSNDPDLYYNLALAQANAHKFDDAMQSIDKAIQLKPAENAYADLKKKIGDFKENEILSKAQGMLNEGDKLFQAKDYSGALAKYQEALKLVPGNKQSVILVQMAKTHSQLSENDQAEALFKKAIEMTPDNADYRKALAQFYLKEKKYDEALNVYADPRAAGDKPVDQTLFTLGQTLNNQGNSEVAQLAFERAIKANPSNAEAYYELGMILFYSKKDDKRAKEVLTKYLELGKDAAHLDNTKSVMVVLKKRSG